MTDYRNHIHTLTNGLKALVVMAAMAEYGDGLKALGVKPLLTGVGPVQAAGSLTHALSAFHHMPQTVPDIIINLGSAGSATLEQGEVYRVSGAGYRDMDASAFGFPKGQTPFSLLPAVIEFPDIMQGFPKASCSTGANVVVDHAAVKADMSDMELSALADVAMKFAIPIIAFKGISDGKEPLAGKIEQWEELLPHIDRKLACALTELGKAKEEELCRMPLNWKEEMAVFAQEPVKLHVYDAAIGIKHRLVHHF